MEQMTTQTPPTYTCHQFMTWDGREHPMGALERLSKEDAQAFARLWVTDRAALAPTTQLRAVITETRVLEVVGPEVIDLSRAADCTCVIACAEDPATACSLSGHPHVHPDDGTGVFGPCPVHPDAPGDR